MATGKSLGEVYPTMRAKFAQQWPKLTDRNHKTASCADSRYNCIAYAANITNKWWWPSLIDPNVDHWPTGVPDVETVEAFVMAYSSIGYLPCGMNAELEDGFEKIAIYAIGNEVKHAARQLPSGIWVSKLGKGMDIEHELDALDGPCYGSPSQFMRRHYLIAALFNYPSGLGS
jgi:hypothetical protein